jgi:hypothetical protein
MTITKIKYLESGEARWIGRPGIHSYCTMAMMPSGREGWRREPDATRPADELPAKAFIKTRGGVEIRLGGRAAQSVLPPSVHPSGRQYAWLVSPQRCGPALLTLADLGITH